MSTETTQFTQPIDLWRLRFDKGYYEELRADILLRLYLQAELRKEFFKELEMQVLYGEGSDVLPTGVLGTG